MANPLDEWLARAEEAKRLAALQANYGCASPFSARAHLWLIGDMAWLVDSTADQTRLGTASSTQLKFLDIIGDIDPRLVQPRSQVRANFTDHSRAQSLQLAVSSTCVSAREACQCKTCSSKRGTVFGMVAADAIDS